MKRAKCHGCGQRLANRPDGRRVCQHCGAVYVEYRKMRCLFCGRAMHRDDDLKKMMCVCRG